MLINFSIQNFGSIKDKQTLSFEADNSKHLEDYYIIETNGLRLLKLGLIYGANASGKTTILKALDFLRTLVLNPKVQKTETFDFEPFLFDENTPNENTIFEIEFLQNNIRYFYKVELNKKAIVNEELYAYYTYRQSNVFTRTTDLKNELTNIVFGNKIKIEKLEKKSLETNTLWNNTVFGGFSKINLDIKELREITDWFKSCLMPMITPHKDILTYLKTINQIDILYKKNIIEMLKKADFNISEIHRLNWQMGQMFSKNNPFAKPSDFLYFEHSINNKRYKIDYKYESQGTQRYFGFAGILYLLIKNSTFFSIDELESSLHPDLYQHFLLSFLVNSKNSQLLATTHNREFLMDKDVFRNDAIWITDKDNEQQATELYSLADFDTSVIRNTTSIFNAYKIGKLGGTPNLGDYYINTEDDEKE